MKKLLAFLLIIASNTAISGVIYYKGVGFSDTSSTYADEVYAATSPFNGVIVGRIQSLRETGTNLLTNNSDNNLDVWFKVRFPFIDYSNNNWYYKQTLTIDYFTGNKSDWYNYIDPLLSSYSGISQAANLLDTYKIDNLVTFSYASNNPSEVVARTHLASGNYDNYLYYYAEKYIGTTDVAFDTNYFNYGQDHIYKLTGITGLLGTHNVINPDIKFKLNPNAIPEPSILWLFLAGLPLLTIKTKRI